MYWSLLLASCWAVVASAEPDSPRLGLSDTRLKFQSSELLEKEWQAFKINYNKTYEPGNEELFRMKIFAEHLEAIEYHNRLYSKGLKTFTMGINRFSDLEHSEFIKLMTGHRPRNPSEDSSNKFLFKPEGNATSPPPDEIDWRTKGYVTPVKNQDGCGSCWAFSATGALEGQHFRKTGKLVSISEQQLVDCSKEGSHGCKGGDALAALQYIASNGGIDTEESYPYEHLDGKCRYNPVNVGATCKSVTHVAQSESELQSAVGTVGPISVIIHVISSFRHYSSGVYDDVDCCSECHNHAVLVVGYGKTPTGLQYWIVKNSWGADWGMEGYIWMSRNKDNQCGITREAGYPDV